MSSSLTYRISKYLAAVVVMIGLFGCRSQQPISTNVVQDSVYIERWQYDSIAPDTSYVITLIECDSLTNKPIIQVSDVYVDDLKLWVERQTNNQFKFGAIRPPDRIKTIYTNNSNTTKEIVAVERNLNRFEWFLIISGIVGWLTVILSLTIKIYKYVKSF